jgi:hypothetical protein
MVSPLRLFALLAPVAACGALVLAAPNAVAHEPPEAVTEAATDVGPTAATLNGVVTPNGHYTTYTFVYGTTRYDAHTPLTEAGNGSTPVAVSARVEGLTAATTYHVRLIAFSHHGFARGDDVTFTTPAAAPPPPLPQPPPSSPPPAGSPPSTVTTFSLAPPGPPVLGESVKVAVRSGTVTVKLPGAAGYISLSDAASIPVGAILNTRAGSVTLTSALANGGTQAGIFHGGLFEVRQPKAAGGLTELVLRGAPPSCPRASAGAAAVAKRKRKPPRRLWGHDDHGNFRTRGGSSVATVRGTVWYVEDRCDGTLTRVSRGTVSVYDSGRHRSVIVHAGHSYLARASR